METLFQSGDIECFKDFFCLVVKNNKDTKTKNIFKIGKYHNDLQRLYSYIELTKITFSWFMFSYNGNRYDWIIINYLLYNKKQLLQKTSMQVVTELYTLNKEIQIYRDDLHKSHLKRYLYKHPFYSIDLMCFWTISTIKSKKLSLKFFEVSMDLDIEECTINWDKEDLTEEECNQIVAYCEKDVDALMVLAEKLREKINSRFDVIKEYGATFVPCLSWDDVKIGYETLLADIAKENNVKIQDLPSRTLHESVKLKNIIIPELQFNSPRTGNTWKERDKTTKKITECFDNFSDMFDFILKQEVKGTKELSIRVKHKGIIHDIKSGGLHSYHDGEIRVRKEGYIYKDVDVSSYYPTLGAERGFVPKHLAYYGFSKLIKRNKDERVLDKLAGRIGQANIKKLKLNGGFYGNTNQEFRKFYDWQCTLQITVNGQLLLLKLIEDLTSNPLIQEDMCNTDGATFYFPESELEFFNTTCKKWEEFAKVELEAVDYELVVKNSINHYIAFYRDKKGTLKTKEKGSFNTNPEIDASKSFLICPKIVLKYFEQRYFYNTEIDILEEVKNHTNIYDFCSSAKIDKSYIVIYNGQKVQQLNRYFVSNNGYYLYKQKKGTNKLNSISELSGTKITLLNKKSDIPQLSTNNYNIDYNWYVDKIKGIISDIVEIKDKNKQLKLF